MMKTFLDDFFHGFSRIVIFIPLLIVGAALLFKYWPKQPALIENLPVAVDEARPAKGNFTDSVKTTVATSSANFNLSGPLVCLAGDNAMYIKNQQLKVILTEGNSEVHYSLNGDCFYNWQKGALYGEKVCGLGMYLTIFSKLPLNGILDSGLLSILNNKVDDRTGRSIIKLLEACKDKPIDNMDLFDVPKQVIFKKGELP